MTVAPAPRLKRRGLTADELAQRWGMSKDRTLETLRCFERRGYARRCGRYWFATKRAKDLHL